MARLSLEEVGGKRARVRGGGGSMRRRGLRVLRRDAGSTRMLRSRLRARLASRRGEERRLATLEGLLRVVRRAYGVFEARGDGVVLALARDVLVLRRAKDLARELRLEVAPLHLLPQFASLALDRCELFALLVALHLRDVVLRLQGVAIGGARDGTLVGRKGVGTSGGAEDRARERGEKG